VLAIGAKDELIRSLLRLNGLTPHAVAPTPEVIAAIAQAGGFSSVPIAVAAPGAIAAPATPTILTTPVDTPPGGAGVRRPSIVAPLPVMPVGARSSPAPSGTQSARSTAPISDGGPGRRRDYRSLPNAIAAPDTTGVVGVTAAATAGPLDTIDPSKLLPAPRIDTTLLGSTHGSTLGGLTSATPTIVPFASPPPSGVGLPNGNGAVVASAPPPRGATAPPLNWTPAPNNFVGGPAAQSARHDSVRILLS
jgi:hypothetical protein